MGCAGTACLVTIETVRSRGEPDPLLAAGWLGGSDAGRGPGGEQDGAHHGGHNRGQGRSPQSHAFMTHSRPARLRHTRSQFASMPVPGGIGGHAHESLLGRPANLTAG